LTFTASTSPTAAAAAAPITSGGHTLDLTNVSVTVSRVDLKRARTDACAIDDDDEADDDHPQAAGSTVSCGELKVGPMTVDLPLAGGVVTVPANTIPVGSFRELDLRVSQVRLKGTYDGKAFDVTVPVHVKSEVEFATPIVVTEGKTVDLTVNVPVGGWFLDSNGALIDPSTINANSSVLAKLKNRIAASFRAFEDHDHDGHEDHD